MSKMKSPNMFLPFTGLFSRLQLKLFSYFAVSLLAILLIATAIESVVLNQLLTLPTSTQEHLQKLAHEAKALLEKNDIEGLAKWEEQQDFTLYILDKNQHSVSQREMHPHFVFKLQYMRQLQQPMGDRVRKPLIGIPLFDTLNADFPLTLVVQLNADLHPAQQLSGSLWLIRSLVGITVLFLFSSLLGRYLIRPLTHLQMGTKALAGGELTTRIAHHFSVKEPEFYHLATEFDYMAEQLQNSMQNQERLLRDVSHELRTPLARQEIALHLLEKQATAQQMPLISRFKDQNEQMAKLIDSILRFSRLNNTNIDLNPSSFSISSLRHQILRDIEFEAGEKQTIQWAEPGEDIPLYTDSSYLISAIENVLRNALKYAGQDCSIMVSCWALDETLRLDLQDDGPGINKDELITLFNPFTRMDEARHSSQGGYGLGLAIVKQSIKLLGGEVSARNCGGGGLCISMSLPLNLKCPSV
ncbi:HAMP domain-containing sensor histidine kinase [Shewanella atlantica]|uniref:histidine kinase n=1 Tax=Shewanella atlantica TaxID=271099 RepID=A0A3S0KLX1_9GAMM|nr:histidine kinase sensor domain-containing protein [Shewanella atlantica]RTR33726.1 HAMP domain-containing protein [Shewanella atlantica]